MDNSLKKFQDYTKVIMESLDAKSSPEEKQFVKLEVKSYDDQLKEVQVKGKNQDIEERKKYASMIFWMVAGWLAIILGIIIACGFGKLTISDAVIMSLIGSTTINVTTFFVIVTKYLFPSNS